MVKYDIDKIMSDIIDVNTGLSCGSWSFKDRVEISAYGNFTPHGSRIPRPADVRFIFCESHYNKYGGTINMLIVLHKELCTYFRKNGYHIQGNITTKNGLNLLRNLKKKSFFDIEIPLSIDLCKYNKIDILKIFDMSGISDIKLVLKNFYWKNTKKQYDSSRLYVWIDKEMKCNFQIEIDKEIDEEDLIFIETEINEEFEYIGYQ